MKKKLKLPPQGAKVLLLESKMDDDDLEREPHVQLSQRSTVVPDSSPGRSVAPDQEVMHQAQMAKKRRSSKTLKRARRLKSMRRRATMTTKRATISQRIFQLVRVL